MTIGGELRGGLCEWQVANSTETCLFSVDIDGTRGPLEDLYQDREEAHTRHY